MLLKWWEIYFCEVGSAGTKKPALHGREFVQLGQVHLSAAADDSEDTWSMMIKEITIQQFALRDISGIKKPAQWRALSQMVIKNRLNGRLLKESQWQLTEGFYQIVVFNYKLLARFFISFLYLSTEGLTSSLWPSTENFFPASSFASGILCFPDIRPLDKKSSSK